MRAAALLMVVLACQTVYAQTNASHADDFQSYGALKNVPGWFDVAVGGRKPLTRPVYQTWPDPTQPANVVYGTKETSGGDVRSGVFSILETRFNGRFEFRGRLLRTNDDARLGVSFFSSYPDRDAYYLIALSGGGGGKRRSVKSQAQTMTMQLTAYGGAAPGGTLDSDVPIDPDRWYAFLIEADSFENATHIRARFWPDGTTEPTLWQIEARDTSVWRLDDGRVGVWSAAKGESYIDDLAVRSWPETADRIRFLDADTDQELDPSRLALFKRPARVDVQGASRVMLDGVEYAGAPIVVDGFHSITAEAGFQETALRLLVDQTAPVIELLGNGSALVDGHVFGGGVTVDARVTDVSDVEVTSSSGPLPLPLAQEATHTIIVHAEDQVGWRTGSRATFTIDQTPPVVTIHGNGLPFLAGHTFNQDVALTWSVTDATLSTVGATLNGVPVESGALVSSAEAHSVVVTASDRAGHSTRVERNFVIRRDAPEVRLFADGAPFVAKAYGMAIAITAEILDSTPTTQSALLDGVPYDLGTAVAVEGVHTFTITVTNAAGLRTTLGPVSFSVDVTPPVLTVSESGSPFIDGSKFNRDVVPLLNVHDNQTATPARVLFVNDVAYIPGAPINQEGAAHVLRATATDEAGHTTTAGPFRFVLDKTRPTVTLVDEATGLAFQPTALFARPVKVKTLVEDLTATTVAATREGAAIDLNAAIAADGIHRLSVIATDLVGWQSVPATATITIDTIPPAIRVSSPAGGATLSTPEVDIAGFADDATSITINGRTAQIDLLNKAFALRSVSLGEGLNELHVVAVDEAGNTARSTHAVNLDTLAPRVGIAAPEQGACFGTTAVEVRGTVSDRSVAAVTVNGIPATVGNGGFVASVPIQGEGEVVIVAEATDDAGHAARASVAIIADRTAPQVEVFESAQPFTATLLTRAVAPFARVADRSVTTVLTTLNGQPYVGGTAVADDGRYELKVVATDCAGHESTKTVVFEIDRRAPQILSIVPPAGSTQGARPTITGTTSSDAATVLVESNGKSYPVLNGTFAIPDAPLVDGANDLRFVVTDRAGNSSELDYRLILDLSVPVVEIVENGLPIPAGALFNREVRPVFRTTKRDATVTATLNGSALEPGSSVTISGSHALTATARDGFGRVSSPAVATFTIDRESPSVAIASPVDGINTKEDQLEVRGTVTGGDVLSVLVNGLVAVVSAGSFSAIVPLDVGPNLIIALATDRAGNSSADEVHVTRGGGPVGILLTAPYDGLVTNRRTTVVAGQVLTMNGDTRVTINGRDVVVDPGGFFRLSDFSLTEGETLITAVVTSAAESNQVSVRVHSDVTPPLLRLLESGRPLADGARFAERAAVSAEATDGAVRLAPLLTVDGAVGGDSTVIEERGGHTIVALARDPAGNETRVERTIFVGGTGSATCRLQNFDPPPGAVVTSTTAVIAGQSGGAPGVRVNGTPALVSGESFCATIDLPSEGENVVTITCTDTAGAPTGEAATLLLRRATGEPSITMEMPEEGAITAEDTIVVNGSAIGASVVEVNGSQVSFDGTRWSAPSVRLSPGLNVINCPRSTRFRPHGRTVPAGPVSKGCAQHHPHLTSHGHHRWQPEDRSQRRLVECRSGYAHDRRIVPGGNAPERHHGHLFRVRCVAHARPEYDYRHSS